MKRNAIGRWTVVLAAMWTTALPQWGFAIDQKSPVAPGLPPLVVRDVALDSTGVLRGTLTNSAGQPQKATELTVWQSGEVLKTVKSQDDGKFVIRDLRPGLYEINTARSLGLYRVWPARSAPPAAQPAALIVEGDTVIRAQQMGAWRRALILSGVIITSGVIGGVIGYNIKDDAS